MPGMCMVMKVMLVEMKKVVKWVVDKMGLIWVEVMVG